MSSLKKNLDKQSETKNQIVSDQVAAKNTQSHMSRFTCVLVTLDMFCNKTDNLSKSEQHAEIQFTSKDLG